MQFLRIEKALNKLAGSSDTDGQFDQTAGIFENILKDESLIPEKKAEKIAEVLEERAPNQPSSPKN